MPRGGSRPGAGRKSLAKGRLVQARETVQQHVESMADLVPPEIAKMSPLQIMLRAMALDAAAGKWKDAAKHAADAAPYVHARLSNVAVNATLRRDPSEYSDDELAALASGLGGEAGDGEAGGRPH